MTLPPLSVVLLAPTDLAHIEKTIRHLRVQTCVAKIELLVVTPYPSRVQSAAQSWTEFHSVRVLESAAPLDSGLGRAMAVRAANAPLIAFAEDHAFPEPNWADRLITCFDGPFDAVGVEMKNANPSSLSVADMLLSFGPWIAPARRGEYPKLPGHNTAYRTATLREFGAQLSRIMNSEAVLHHELVRRGHRLFLESDTSVAHVNLSEFGAFAQHKFLGGRIFAGLRWRQNHWSLSKRILYGLGAPLVPFIRFKRLLPDMKRVGLFDPISLDSIAFVAVGLAFHATGEMVGYFFGSGESLASYARLELFRESGVRMQDKHLIFN